MRILLVEDDKVLADALSRALVQCAHAVDAVSTGEEADHALSLAIYDLAILDIGLPGLSGLDVLKRLRARKSTMPVLMLTAFDTTEEYRLMAGAGLSFRQILASLTTAPAQRFGFARKGKVAAGMDGDLTILSADPAADVSAFARVAWTVRAGKVIYTAGR